MRDFNKNPVTYEELHECYWYAVEDDLIEGWNISNVDLPMSQQDIFQNHFIISSFMRRETAQHIANLHNANWLNSVWDSYAFNIACGSRELGDEPLS